MCSAHGLLYGRTYERLGLDPAAFLEERDDVLAYNFRVGMTLVLARRNADTSETDDTHPEARKHDAGMDRAHRNAELLRAANVG